MCEALEQLMKKEIEAKVEAGRKEGTSNASLSHIRNIMAALHTSAEEAMNMLGIPMEERAFYISKIEK